MKSPTKHKSRPCVRLVEEIDRRLMAYALAGGAALTLAAAKPAASEIVYTPTDVRVGSGNVTFDLNQDGIPDFNIGQHSQRFLGSIGSWSTLQRVTLGGNVGASAIFSNGSAAVLPSGATIGSGQKFRNVNTQRAPMMSATRLVDTSGSSINFAQGNWKNAKERYLGLKFTINGQVHYGWARMTVRYINAKRIHAILLGYAYETNPGQSILAGQITASAVNIEPERPTGVSLGGLALGANGLPLWRKEITMSAKQPRRVASSSC